MSAETGTMSSAFFLMAVVIVARIITAQLLIGKHEVIKSLHSERNQRVSDLRRSRSEREANEQNQLALLRKKVALEKKVEPLRGEVEYFQQEVSEIRNTVIRVDTVPSMRDLFEERLAEVA